MRNKKSFSIIGFLTLLLVCMFAFGACGDEKKKTETPPEQTATYVLNEPILTVYVDETFSLSVLGLDDQTKASWQSANISVAKVGKDGTVTGIFPGKTTIRVSYGDTELTCQVTVEIRYNAVPQITLGVAKTEGAYALRLMVGDGYDLAPTFTVGGETVQTTFSYTGATEAITVENGRVTATAAGTATVTVSCEYEGKTYAASVAVTAEEVA